MLKSQNKWDVAKAERQAVNFAVQGSSAEQTKLAMGRIWTAGIHERYETKFLGVIHDEVLLEIPVQHIPNAVPEVHALMTAPYADMCVPVESSVSMGANFHEQHELNAAPTPENLQAMLRRLGYA